MGIFKSIKNLVIHDEFSFLDKPIPENVEFHPELTQKPEIITIDGKYSESHIILDESCNKWVAFVFIKGLPQVFYSGSFQRAIKSCLVFNSGLIGFGENGILTKNLDYMYSLYISGESIMK